MRNAYVFEGIAVLVGPWHEPMTPPERGARVEVRLLDLEPKRGSRFAAERVVLDQPVFRADLFDRTDSPAGNLKSAHFHPRFDGIEPCDRHWDEAIQRDPAAWLAGELRDLDGAARTFRGRRRRRAVAGERRRRAACRGAGDRGRGRVDVGGRAGRLNGAGP